MDYLVVGKELDFKTSPCEDGDTQQRVWSFVDDGDPPEDRAEVGIVGACEASPVAEDDVEGPLPALYCQIELGNDLVMEILAPLSMTPGSSTRAHIPGAMVAVYSVGSAISTVALRRASTTTLSLLIA